MRWYFVQMRMLQTLSKHCFRRISVFILVLRLILLFVVGTGGIHLNIRIIFFLFFFHH